MRTPQYDVAATSPTSPTSAPRAVARGARPAHPHAPARLQQQYGNRQARAIIQAKLKVGPVDDRYEREADRMSRLAMGSSAQRAPEAIHHVQGSTGGVADPEVAQAVDRARGGGRPVPGGVRERMEAVSGADFSAVRVHVDAEADRLNSALGARAFTVGADVFVRRSEYRPGSARGDALLAHELTHTVQQGAALCSTPAPAVTTPIVQGAWYDDVGAWLYSWFDWLRSKFTGGNAAEAPPVTITEGQVAAAAPGAGIDYPGIDSCLTVTVRLANGGAVGAHLSLFQVPGAMASNQVLPALRNMVGNTPMTAVEIVGDLNMWHPTYFTTSMETLLATNQPVPTDWPGSAALLNAVNGILGGNAAMYSIRQFRRGTLSV